ncbi:SRPBCC family protein [Gordonia aurantiaca]|uniref:SRPBCC family protein n=1 Tax=Gordonia sp. B21 TaxID=3151852 RepID=UPI0032637DA6
MRSRHVSTVIGASPEAVYEFIAEPDNLPKWAGGLARSEVTRCGDDLIAESPMGTVTVRFVPRNEFGVVDHDVVLPDGGTVNNPMRVLAHPDGAEVVFTLRQREMSDEEFDRDTGMVEEDLSRLRALLEAHDGRPPVRTRR